MPVRMLLSLSVILLLVAVAAAAPKPKSAPAPAPEPKECPVSERSLEAIAQAITAAGSCDKSMEVFEACSYAASGDVPLGEAVIKTCEGDFQAKLNAGQRKTYEQAVKGCWQKYRHESGTMYRSFEAMCAAAVAQRYSRRFLNVRAPASRN
jgi:hypothetical protein